MSATPACTVGRDRVADTSHPEVSSGSLTSVFYEARFSTRPLTQAHREAAEQALTELAASLAGAAT